MAKAWAVVSGEYSDYRVHAVCLFEDVAIGVAERLGGDCTVEEFPLLSSADQYITLVSYGAQVNVRLDGQLEDVTSPGYRSLYRPEAPRAHYLDHWSYVRVTVTASTQEAATRAAAEYGAELAVELAAGVPPAEAVAAFNARRSALGIQEGDTPPAGDH